ncbi:MAG: VWA domain-containing protein [Planctomycetota bacterium]|nr:VWA domain-containing protein [Planctomycetota bacterium]
MTFAYPQLILLLVLPVTLIFWEWVRRGQPLVLPFDHVRQSSGRWLGWLVLTANSLPAALLALAILFLARPITYAPPKTERKLSNIQIVLDCSGSMREPYGPQPSDRRYARFDGAMDAIDKFLTAREGDAFGLTIFSRNFLHWVPLTQDTSAIRMARPFIHPNVFPDKLWGGTYIAKAVDGAIGPLSRHAEGDRMIILLTDGEGLDIVQGQERDVIVKLQRQRIVVFAIALNDGGPAPGLVNIARETGGQTFTALTPQALNLVFHRIDQMQKVEVRAERPQVIDDFEPFVRPALILLGLQVLVIFGLRFTPW